MTEFDVDAMIRQLLKVKDTGKIAPLGETKIRHLCMLTRDIFLKECNLLEVSPPINIVGDIHGQFQDLLRHFDKVGYPDKESFIFLGDYVDRGPHSLETICL